VAGGVASITLSFVSTLPVSNQTLFYSPICHFLRSDDGVVLENFQRPASVILVSDPVLE
jgi:hypothetical protein